MSAGLHSIHDTEGGATVSDEFWPRCVAAEAARNLLMAKAGKFAERPVDPIDLILLAEWLLGDDVTIERESPVDSDVDICETFADAARGQGERIRQTLDRIARGQRHPWTSDGLCACPECKAVEQ